MAWCRTRIYISRLYCFSKSADLPVVSFLRGWVGSYENNCFGSNVNTDISSQIPYYLQSVGNSLPNKRDVSAANMPAGYLADTAFILNFPSVGLKYQSGALEGEGCT